jgi:hypothetical protein
LQDISVNAFRGCGEVVPAILAQTGLTGLFPALSKIRSPSTTTIQQKELGWMQQGNA